MNGKLIQPPLNVVFIMAFMLIMAGLYWYGAVEQLTAVNTDLTTTDQDAYIFYARELYESDYTFIGTRNRMPIYPFFQSLFYRPTLTDEAFFVQGKYVNLILSFGLLAGLAAIFKHYLPLLQALNLLLIVAFTVFIFKAGYFQVELLFYFVNFCLFLLFCHLLQKMSWKVVILGGVVAGIAHLTKASILPGLAMFLLFAGAKGVVALYQHRHALTNTAVAKPIIDHFLTILLVVIFFLITIFPYINQSKRQFGRYFYNVNSTFYIWYDSWEEVKQGTKAHGDRLGWPDMPPEEIPSMAKYLREHTPQQIVARFVKGGQRVFATVTESYGYFKYGVIYSCLLLVAVFWNGAKVQQAIKSNPLFYLFLCAYFAGYALLYFWYVPIADGNRLVLAQFIPLMFCLVYAVHKLLFAKEVTFNGRSLQILEISNFIVLAIILVDIFFIVTQRVGTIYGGT